jgi:peroxiredoxin (alkyl hydroperoxide reductase subunit C)
VGRSVDETLRLLQAFQHIRNNPDEVCPANWTPGQDAMKATHTGVADYLTGH